MKNITKIVAAALLIAAVPLTTVSAQTSNAAPANLSDTQKTEIVNLVKEEKTAKSIYDALSTKFPDVFQFKMLARSESKHVKAGERLMAKFGITDATDIQAPTIPDDQTKAIEFAINFEKEDIALLDQMLASATDDIEKRVLNNLREASVRHEELLKLALEGKTSLEALQADPNFSHKEMRKGFNDENKSGWKNEMKGFMRKGNMDPANCPMGTPGEGAKDGSGFGKGRGMKNGNGEGMMRQFHQDKQEPANENGN